VIVNDEEFTFLFISEVIYYWLYKAPTMAIQTLVDIADKTTHSELRIRGVSLKLTPSFQPATVS
jgi:hypothetical protein